MAGSLIVAVRSALLADLGTLDSLYGVEIGLGYRFGTNARERIFTRDARFDHTPAALRAGRNFRHEEGRFGLVVLVEGVARDYEWTADRALTLGLAVEEYIADHKNGDLTDPPDGLQTLLVDGEGRCTELGNDSGTLAELILPIHYTARLT